VFLDEEVLVVKEDIQCARWELQLIVSAWVMKRDLGQLVFLQ
jgi:hypothetical protein